jgi:DNA repair exonuclease SbcCD ATPase subunit
MNTTKIFRTLLILSLTPLFFACTGELEEKISDLEAERRLDSAEIGNKEEMIIEFINSMNEIEGNLATIKEKENIITTRFDDGNGEINNVMKDQIIDDINLINNLLQENKNKMSALNSRLNKSNLKISELDKMIESLAHRLQQKDSEIAGLQRQLAEANKQLKVLFEEYNDRLEEIGDQEDQLNTAYYCYGSSKELKEQGVITKEGGFIGIGKTAKLSKDFNKEYFTKVDISLTSDIELMSKKANIITNHPSDSYEIEGEGDAAERIVIKDASAFWSSSKYLVVVVEN